MDAGSTGVSDGSSEVLFRTSRAETSRVRFAAGERSVIVKRLRGAAMPERLRQQVRTLKRLAGTGGVPQLVDGLQLEGCLVMEDVPGVRLSQVLQQERLAQPEVVRLGLELACIIAAVHRRGVLHRDINPDNLLLAGTERRVVLIEFETATTYAQEQPVFTHHKQILGSLAYMSPEQTGRTGRPVDQRSDLYAAGATLYQLATGRVPFPQRDALALVHDHLTSTPPSPAELDPGVPPQLSAIIMRLLEKEPDRRYQGAEGLAFDLARLRASLEGGGDDRFPLAEHDFPPTLIAPSRLAGREVERAQLAEAFDRCLHTSERSVRVSGPAGVGKTALVDELRVVVSQHGGWFVKGRCDEFRRDASGAIRQALGALGRLLLAEPDLELAAQCVRIEEALGDSARRLALLVPEFAIILGAAAERPGDDPVEAEQQLRQAVVDVLRTVASPERPLVFVLDDLQWAGPFCAAFVQAIGRDSRMRGLLLIAIDRGGEQSGEAAAAPLQIRLANLSPVHMSGVLAEMLRLSPAAAVRLGDTLAGRTAGNPLDTLELVNALRRDGALVPSSEGWLWDEATIRRYVGTGKVVDLLAVRLERLTLEQRRIVSVLACLGGSAPLVRLAAATALDEAALLDAVEAPLEDGLLMFSEGHAIRFAHDRVRATVYANLSEPERIAQHLLLARRLAPGRENAFPAAEQYLIVEASLERPAEARVAAALFREAAAVVRLEAMHAAAERFLAAAVRLLERVVKPRETALVEQVQCERHAVLYSLARYDDGDAVYAALVAADAGILVLAAAACVQVSSLTNRGRPSEALELGLALLPRLGVALPALDLPAEVARGLDDVQAWLAAGLPLSERDPAALPIAVQLALAAQLTAHLLPTAFFSRPLVSFWLALERHRLWLANGGPGAFAAGLIGSVIPLIVLRRDYRGAYRFARFALTTAGAAGERDACRSAHVFSCFAAHWGQPFDDTFAYVQRNRAALLKAGDTQFACYSYYASLPAVLECRSLESLASEASEALAFVARSKTTHVRSVFASYGALAQTLRGVAPGTEDPPEAAASDPSEGAEQKVFATAVGHVNRALAAAILGDAGALDRNSAAALPLLRNGFYFVSTGHVLRAFALARHVRERAAARLPFEAELGELDASLTWVRERAQDAPKNFAHLTAFLEAERAAAVGDTAAAASAFEAALAAVDGSRPWHRALITECAGAFYVTCGFELSAGRALLLQARRLYDNWGAAVKVGQLEKRYPFLRALEAESAASDIDSSPDALDLLAILRVSQTLSSETNLDRLRTRIVDLLGVMTGASAVHVALFDDEKRKWFVSAGGNDGAPRPIDHAHAAESFPMSAFRYVERTRKPLIVNDATRDDRFANDAYVTRLARCSLLVVPISSQGTLRAVLLLENRLTAGAFTGDRLQALTLLAGQLAVSLENASLYTSLERKVVERTAALQIANERLEALSTTDSLTGIANRRRFVDFLEAEWKRALRTRASIAIAIVDVDHFKRYNDRYGHPAGDACLRTLADKMGRQLRQGIDLIARYGGEEFVIVLPGADLAAAQHVIQRVCAAVALIGLVHENAERGIVTVSIGAAAMVPQGLEGSQALIGRADAALYQAKSNGRNITWVEDESA